MKHELVIAHEVQARLFPQTLPESKTIEYAGVCKAARHVSGDYYDFLPLSGNKIGIALGDISGKGISAALLMASLQALIRSNASVHGTNVADLMSTINNFMNMSTDRNKFATFFYSVYDDIARTLTYVNAGHNPPILFRPQQSSLDIVVRPGFELSFLTEGGIIVGSFANSTYKQETIQLLPGDILVIFSDGVIEAINEKGAEFSQERLIDLVKVNASLSPEELLNLIIAEIEHFTHNTPQHDDITLIIAKAKE